MSETTTPSYDREERGGRFMPSSKWWFVSYTVSQSDFSQDLLQPWTGNPLGTPTVRLTMQPSGPTGAPHSALLEPDPCKGELCLH